MVDTLRWSAEGLELLDQTLLPNKVSFVRCTSANDVSNAIRRMVVRGAPAIGVAAAYGVACEAVRLVGLSVDEFQLEISNACEILAASRPTAVNLVWAINHMRAVIQSIDRLPSHEMAQVLIAAAQRLHELDVETNRAIGRHGADLIPRGARILTHCNAGALATTGFGTALGVIREAWIRDKSLSVIADETRPLLQGARLTAWELMEDGIPTTLITDNMSGYLLAQGAIDICLLYTSPRPMAMWPTRLARIWLRYSRHVMGCLSMLPAHVQQWIWLLQRGQRSWSKNEAPTKLPGLAT
mgnify:CR=1 FL=1